MRIYSSALAALAFSAVAVVAVPANACISACGGSGSYGGSSGGGGSVSTPSTSGPSTPSVTTGSNTESSDAGNHGLPGHGNDSSIGVFLDSQTPADDNAQQTMSYQEAYRLARHSREVEIRAYAERDRVEAKWAARLNPGGVHDHLNSTPVSNRTVAGEYHLGHVFAAWFENFDLIMIAFNEKNAAEENVYEVAARCMMSTGSFDC